MGGQPFQNVTRPDESNQCPENTSPCSSNTQAENTVCYAEEDLEKACPITDVQVIESSATTAFRAKGYTILDVAFNSTASVAYYKGADNLPLTQFKLEASPCIDPY